MLIEKGKTVEIITHDGKFHSDEVFAVFVVKSICDRLRVPYTIKRTRDMDIICEPAPPDVHRIRIDVGGRLNPDAGFFDHHQKGGAGFRNVGEKKNVPFASAGLIWNNFGHQYCIEFLIEILSSRDSYHKQVINEFERYFNRFSSIICNRPRPNFMRLRNAFNELASKSYIAKEYAELDDFILEAAGYLSYMIERDVVAAIDCSDVRDSRVNSIISSFHLTRIINTYNIDWIGMSMSADQYAEIQFQKFMDAVEMLEPTIIGKHIFKLLVEECSANFLDSAEIISCGDRFQNICIINDINASRINIGKVAKYLEVPCQIVVIPSNSKVSVASEDDDNEEAESGGTWVAYSLNAPNTNERFLFPQSWGGLTNEELVNVCGIDGAKFCHIGRFIISAETLDQILEMCKIAMKNFFIESAKEATTQAKSGSRIDFSKFSIPEGY